jgi:hypothetical protein
LVGGDAGGENVDEDGEADAVVVVGLEGEEGVAAVVERETACWQSVRAGRKRLMAM